TMASILFLAGIPNRWFGGLMLTGVVGLSLLAVLAPYRLARLLAFWDPWADQFNRGYQLIQSLIAFGRGAWFGVGLGNGIQKLFYLPEAHTDFIFAVIGEELGLWGDLTVLGLLAIVVGRGLYIAHLAQARLALFECYLALGI
ncbi:MAG: FtsW/RodA/SpoVE family cell cycle protein, partial [Pseudomonadota bacterium]